MKYLSIEWNIIYKFTYANISILFAVLYQIISNFPNPGES